MPPTNVTQADRATRARRDAINSGSSINYSPSVSSSDKTLHHSPQAGNEGRAIGPVKQIWNVAARRTVTQRTIGCHPIEHKRCVDGDSARVENGPNHGVLLPQVPQEGPLDSRAGKRNCKRHFVIARDVSDLVARSDDL